MTAAPPFLSAADPDAPPAPPGPQAGRWIRDGDHFFAVEPVDRPTCPSLRLDACCAGGAVIGLWRRVDAAPDFEFFPLPLGEPWPVKGSDGWVLVVRETRCRGGRWEALVELTRTTDRETP